MDVPLTIAMYLSKLKNLLMTVFAFMPFWKFYMLIQMTAIFEVWITQEWAAKVISLNINVLDRMSSTWKLIIKEDTLLLKYETSRSLKKNLD